MDVIQKADSIARRKTFRRMLVASLIGAFVVFAFEQNRPALEHWLREDPSQVASRVKLLLLILCLLIELPVVVIAAYLWRFSNRILCSHRFPPPGEPVIRDTRVLLGAEANRQGRVIQALSICLVVCACIVPVLFWCLESSLFSV